MSTAEKVTLVSTSLGILVLLIGFYRSWWRPRYRRWSRTIRTALEALGGRPEVTDEVSGVHLPKIDPMHTRLTGIEIRQEDQGARLDRLTDLLERQAELHRIAQDHEVRLISLEDTEAERAANREEYTALWRAISERDTIDGEAD